MVKVKTLRRKWKKMSLEEIEKRKSSRRERKMFQDKLKRLKKNKIIRKVNKELIREYVFYYRGYQSSFRHQAYIMDRLMCIATVLKKDFNKITTKDKGKIMKFISEGVKPYSKDFYIEDFEDFLDWLKRKK